MGNRKVVGPIQSVTETFNELTGGTLSATNVAAPLSSTSTEIFGVAVQNDHDSSNDIYVGGQYGQYWRLAAGEGISLGACNLSSVFVRTASGSATVRYLCFRIDS